MQPSHRPVYGTLAAIVALGALLRFYGIDRLPLWDAEGVTLWFARQPLHDLWVSIPKWDFHPPLFATLLKAWSIFGSSELALRSLSAVLGVATIPVVYLLGRWSAPDDAADRTGLGAALLVALSPLLVEYGQEARYQAAWTFAVAVTLCAAVWLVRHEAAACRFVLARQVHGAPAGEGAAPRGARVARLMLVLGAALSLWLHNLSALFLAVLALFFVGWQAVVLKWNRGFIANAVLAAAGVLVLWSPFLRTLLVQSTNLVQQFHLPTPTLLDIAYTIDYWFGINYFHFASFVLLAGLAAGGLYALARRERLGVAVLLAAAAGLPVLLVIVVSYLVKPVLLFRTMIWVSLPWYVLISAGAGCALRGRLRTGALACVAVMFALGTATFYREAFKSPWDQIVASFADADMAAAPIVVTIPNVTGVVIDYYLDKQGHDWPVVGLPRPFPAPDLPNPYPYDITTGPAMTEADVPWLREKIAAHSPVWFVVRAAHLMDPDGIIVRTLEEEKSPAVKTEFVVSDDAEYGTITVYRVD